MARLSFCLLAAASTLAAAPVSAAVIFDGGGNLTVTSGAAVGDFQTMHFNGSMDGTIIDGLTSSLTLTFNGINGGVWSFGYELTNTSGLPLTSSSVTSLGFDVDPDVAPSSISVDGGFNTVASGSISNATQVEACFKTGQGNNCAGGGSIGFDMGETASGTFTLGPPIGTDQLIFSNFVVRYQRINGPGIVNDGSGIGVPHSPVPEPATWAMMLLGFGLLGGAIRSAKRRQRLAVSWA